MFIRRAEAGSATEINPGNRSKDRPPFLEEPS
jgi:hypothetical protein